MCTLPINSNGSPSHVNGRPEPEGDDPGPQRDNDSAARKDGCRVAQYNSACSSTNTPRTRASLQVFSIYLIV